MSASYRYITTPRATITREFRLFFRGLSSVRIILLVAASVTLLSGVPAFAQSTDANPNANTPDVFLDNHRPLIQKKGKPPVYRTVTGKVVDDTGQPVEGAIVTLTNAKTHDKTQFITKKDGRYNFEDVSFTIDYELDARSKTATSDIRKLSQYDHSATVVRILELTNTATAQK